ncbi:MAG: hypothetical protein H8D78_17785 [Chloroflexi bacterium]|nr:hypothetical protein [Chloroflexota bacterium]
MRLRDKHHWLAIVILLAHLALSVLYSVVVPLWEAHDEWAHYKFVEYVARRRALPPPDQRLTEEYQYDEATQPPLYYLLAALPLLAVDTSDNLVPVVNPYATRGTGEGGVNFAVHDLQVERFPWRGTVLAVHLARIMSALMGTLGCLATYLLARFLWPNRPVLALAATALHAFAPQFLFINSVVTNDVLVSVLGGWALYFAARVALEPPRGWTLLGLALSTALAVLTKLTALALAPLAAVALVVGLWRAWRAGQTRRELWRWMGVGLGAAVLLVGGWLWHNWRTAGHPLPRLERQIAPMLQQGFLRGLAWDNLPRLAPYAFQTFWASFGWGNVGPDGWVFTVLAVLCGLAAAGVLLGLWRERWAWRWLSVGLLVFAACCFLALPLYRELRLGGQQLRGRFLLPALPAVALLITWGLSEWLPSKMRAWGLVALGLLALAAALWVPFGLISPAYAAPPLLSEADVPERAQRLGVVFDGQAELVAYDLWPEAVHPGEGLAVTLWWRGLAPMETNYTVGVHLLGAGEQSYGSRNHYPGNGNFATTLWQPGDMFCETYWIEIAADVPAPARGQVAVTLFVDDESQNHLPVYDGQGNPLGGGALFGRLPVRASPSPGYVIQTPAQYVLEEPTGGRIALLGYDVGPPEGLGGRIRSLALYWQAEEPVEGDYTVFMHLLDAQGRFVFGEDGPPGDGNYPTDLWGPGEVVRDERLLSLPWALPAGTYGLEVGLYGLAGGERLAAYDVSGQRLADDAIPLLEITVAGDVQQRFLPYVLGNRPQTAPAKRGREPKNK